MKKLFFTLIAISITSFGNAQKTYDSLWENVYKHEINALPKSANEAVEVIYAKAKKEENSVQTIKSLIYKSKFMLTLEEDAQLKIIQQLNSEIKQAKVPTKNILESIVANLYWDYFKQNRWKFYNRTQTNSKVNAEDFRTWDLETLFEEIALHYENSLQNAEFLQKKSLKEFDEILLLQPNSQEFRPTLYDFLSHNSLEFYKTDENRITKPSYKFEIDKAGFFTDFENEKLVSKDSSSLQLKALQVYQNLLKFHKKDKNPNAFVSNYIDCLDFISEKYILNNKQDLYLQIAKKLRNDFRHHEISTLLDYKIAEIYKSQADSYSPNQNETERFKHQDALAVCKVAQQLFPTSEGAKLCKSLEETILKTEFRITAENHIPSETHSRVLVAYKNTEKLYFTAFKISKSQINAFNKTHNDSSKIAFIQKLNSAKKWEQKLRNENDYQQHKTEIIVPPLTTGNYLLLATTENNLERETNFQTFSLQVTDVSLIETTQNNEHIFQVVNRSTGKPIPNANVQLINEAISRYNIKINKKFTTDKNGQFTFTPNDRHQNVTAIVRTENETAYFDNFYFYKNRNLRDKDDAKTVIKPFVFTDRSIYRPGQTVYFKAILLKQLELKSDVYTFEKVTATLKNPNGEIIHKLELTTNDFGSISGEFKLPESGLTGAFQIEITSDKKTIFSSSTNMSYNQTEILVEEYKRPKFNTEFETLKKAFQLNDSIAVIGNAKAFSGSYISDAKVVYRVVRTANFPSWMRWKSRYFSPSEEMEITHGETITDASGNYTIRFKAIPDNKVSKESQPTFSYAIFADVTDINGETHSAQTSVKVGYHTLKASISFAEKINKNDKENSLKINTSNLNDAFIGTKGILKIYKKKAPKNAQRKRIWEAPDYQDISESEFEKLFPHEPYQNTEIDDKGTLVFEVNFDTEISKEIELKQLKKWISGSYIAEIICKDKWDQTVKDETTFTLFSLDDKKVADQNLISINTNKEQYKPNENVVLKIGSASQDITLSVDVEKNHKIVNSYFIHLNNEIKTLEIPVTEADRGGFAIHYRGVNYNEFNSGTLDISVPYELKNLEIETLTFRDKLQPGATQTWAFKIKGDKKEQLAAEVLASMYDASLDEFKSHNWNFSPINYPKYYATNGNSNVYRSFGTTNFSSHNEVSVNQHYFHPAFDRLNWFGFSFNNDYWSNHNYINNLRIQRSEFDETIQGVVTDESGSPLPGVTINIINTRFGTTTDFDGKYILKINKGEKLSFSYIGYETKEVVNTNIKKLNIQLKPSNSALDEIVVVGYGKMKKSSVKGSVQRVSADALEGKAAGLLISNESKSVEIRGISSLSGNKEPLYIVDGEIVSEISNLNPTEIASIDTLKDAAATAIYGVRAANGVIIITTKAGLKKMEAELGNVTARTNFKETAFFFPNLRTDKNGDIQFEFTIPEALTKWKMQLLAHSKDSRSALKTLTTVTQKELMVSPNMPRFLREGDKIVISSKIASLSDKTLNGFALLQLTDALTGKDIDLLLDNKEKTKNFNLKAKGNTEVSWTLHIPENIQAVQYKIVAKAGDFSDGEQNALPVLSNRMLVTESLPIWVNANQTKTFVLDKLKNNSSSTLKNHKLTLEFTSNPAWYALQALPYLMEYPYECAEQTFARYYANALATFVVNSNPKIKTVFKQWESTDALLSNLEKNEELKSIIIQETPWLRDAQSETEQKKRIALLFDLEKMNRNSAKTIDKLEEMQLQNGGFPWFKGNSYANRNITQHIATGFGHLQKLGLEKPSKKELKIIEKAIHFLDEEIVDDYKRLLERARIIKEKAKSKTEGLKAEKEFLVKNHLSSTQIHYLYMRSFYAAISINEKTATASNYYKKQAAAFWKDESLYNKGLIALILHRNNIPSEVAKIVASLDENSITSEEMGMYWKDNKSSWYWYQAPIETQSLLIEVFTEIAKDTKKVDDLKKWLLKNKQTQNWKTTKATTEAVYALLLQGSDWLAIDETVEITVGGKKIASEKMEKAKVEAGTGYFKTSWNASEITSTMAEVKVVNKNKNMAWGGLYWQYFENLDKITSAKTNLQLSKKLFLKTNSDTGKKLTEINEKTILKIGDLITVRIELNSDRDMEFIHMKDMRASGVEPVNVLSSYKWQDGLGYYESTKDAATHFFFDNLRKGVYVFEYDVRVNNAGKFSNGITTIESMYAPEFSSHSEGIKIEVN